MKKIFEFGGVAAGVVLIAFGIAAIVLGINGKNTVIELKQQAIVGSPDMTPAAIEDRGQGRWTASSIKLPTCNVAGKPVNDGTSARCFADYMRIHALESSRGVPYSQKPRYATADGKGTSDATKAIQPNGQPVDNGARNMWVTETALSTALNTSYMAEQLGNFGIVVGIALLLSGVGFIVLAVGGALRAGGWLFAREAKKAAAK